VDVTRIGKQHGLPSSWASEADVATLVDLAAGLWIYVDTVIRFIGSENSLGPVTQLQIVVSLVQTPQPKAGSANALARMDLLYNFIMQQIPSNVISTVQKILLLNQVFGDRNLSHKAFRMASALDLSKQQFQAACGFIQSVLLFDMASDSQPIAFYHASFMEYMVNPERSREFCIYHEHLEELQLDITRRINQAHSRSTSMLLHIDPSKSLIFDYVQLTSRE
jgi:hypothetical protein